MKNFINKKVNDLEERIINAIARQIEGGGKDGTFNVEIEEGSVIVVAAGEYSLDTWYEESDNSYGVSAAHIMIDEFTGVDEYGKEVEVNADYLKIEDEVRDLVA